MNFKKIKYKVIIFFVIFILFSKFSKVLAVEDSWDLKVYRIDDTHAVGWAMWKSYGEKITTLEKTKEACEKDGSCVGYCICNYGSFKWGLYGNSAQNTQMDSVSFVECRNSEVITYCPLGGCSYCDTSVYSYQSYQKGTVTARCYFDPTDTSGSNCKVSVEANPTPFSTLWETKKSAYLAKFGATYYPVRIPVCCCKPTESGSLSAKYTCSEQKGKGSDADCTGLGTEYKYSAMPSSGGCSSLETKQVGSLDSSANTLAITVTSLKKFAAKLNPAGLTSPLQMIGRGVYFSLAIIGMITLVLYIWAGVLWMTSAGNAERKSQGIKIIVWTTMGALAIAMSYVLVSFIFNQVILMK